MSMDRHKPDISAGAWGPTAGVGRAGMEGQSFRQTTFLFICLVV